MSEIEKAIESLQTANDFIKKYAGEKDAPNLPPYQINLLSIQALQEKQKRGKGCEWCNSQKTIECESGYYGHMGEDKPTLKIYDDIEPSVEIVIDGNSTYFSVKFCPVCGRDLRKGENDG